MNFLHFWPHGINELVFQHLTAAELLNSTLVSRDWNHFIGRSNAFKKILLVPIEVRRSRNLDVLVESQRKYRHLQADASDTPKDIIEIIANPYNNFVSIKISETEFDEERNLEICLLNCCSSIEHLKLNEITFYNDRTDELATAYDFPKLISLHISYKSGSKPYANKYFESFPNLQTLTLTHGCDESIKKLIRKSTKLTKLVISGLFHDVNFFKDLATMPSRLEEFVFNDVMSSSKDDQNLRHFNAFFGSQGKTLRSFKTDALIEPDELENAFNMPQFTELCVRGFHYNRELMQIQLDNLKLSRPKPASLTCFQVDYMDDILFELLALSAPNLKALIVRRFDPTDIDPSYFTKLEILKISLLSLELREVITSKSETERSHFEKLILVSEELCLNEY